MTLDQLLFELSRGSLSLSAAQAELDRQLHSGESAAQLRTRIHAALSAGRIDGGDARALLETLEIAVGRTSVLADQTAVQSDVTQMRPAPDATVQMAAEVTHRTPPLRVDPTLVRTSNETEPADDVTQAHVATQVDATERQSATVVQGAERTVAIEGDETLISRLREAEAMMPTQAQQPAPTSARTLSIGATAVSPDAPYAATLKLADRTEVIASRLVHSLDDGQGHVGPLQPGTVINKRFVLDKLIGKGGMGLVFAAVDRRKEEAHDPNPRVAFKVLNADFQRHPQSFMALQREARKAQSLAHPNVVTVFDFDRDGEAVYMTMELLTGRSLDTMVREARGKGIDKRTALSIVRGIAEGLAYAHRKGIVHSDLKPGNVFITEDGTPKILDFGIARAIPNSLTDVGKDIFDAGSLGAYTEAYATDEMVDGVDPHPADDMYALGIIGYELLTGHHPYQRHGAPTARKLGIKPPSLKGLKRNEARAIECCLSLQRKDRPKDASEFLKLFRGVSTLQKISVGVAAVLALTAGYLWYQNYLETSPAIAFEQLPTQTQQQFSELMSGGDKEWAFYQQGIAVALDAAIEQYAEAYALHPRNRKAVRGLKQSGDAFLALAGEDPQKRREAAQYLQSKSDYYRKYAPVAEAAN